MTLALCTPDDIYDFMKVAPEDKLARLSVSTVIHDRGVGAVNG